MPTTFTELLRVIRECNELTYVRAAELVNCDVATAGKAYRYYETKGEVTIDRATYPYVVRSKSASPAKEVC